MAGSGESTSSERPFYRGAGSHSYARGTGNLPAPFAFLAVVGPSAASGTNSGTLVSQQAARLAGLDGLARPAVNRVRSSSAPDSG
jgi:hypothetical protein